MAEAGADGSTVCKIGALGCYDEGGGFGKHESMYVKHERMTCVIMMCFPLAWLAHVVL